MTDRESDQQSERLQEEYVAACAALVLADTNINALVAAGFPIEHMDIEFRVEYRARANLAQAHRRIEQFEADRAKRDSLATAVIDVAHRPASHSST